MAIKSPPARRESERRKIGLPILGWATVYARPDASRQLCASRNGGENARYCPRRPQRPSYRNRRPMQALWRIGFIGGRSGGFARLFAACGFALFLGCAPTVEFPSQFTRKGDARAIPLQRQLLEAEMAGFARCSRCDHALTSVHVEAVPALGALPAAFRVFVVVCSNCRTALGTSIIGPAHTDSRSRFHEASTSPFGACVPFAAVTANAMASRALAYLAPKRAPSDRRRTQTVHQRVRVLLAAHD